MARVAETEVRELAAAGARYVTTATEYGDCIAKHERCQIEESIGFTVPRIDEFFTVTLQPNPFGSTFCPAP